MTILEAIKARHSVRAYTKRPIDGAVLEALQQEIERVNEQSGLRIRLVLNEPKAFSSLLAHYGKFENADNYLALFGKDDETLYPLCGYWGEHLVLTAQTLGLNTCWVAGSYKKSTVKTLGDGGEKLAAVISIGYAASEGHAHRSKTYEQVTETHGPVPQWFRDGVEAALLAPTAINQQRFKIVLRDGNASIAAQRGPYARIDLGIVQYHFEAASGHSASIE